MSLADWLLSTNEDKAAKIKQIQADIYKVRTHLMEYKDRYDSRVVTTAMAEIGKQVHELGKTYRPTEDFRDVLVLSSSAIGFVAMVAMNHEVGITGGKALQGMDADSLEGVLECFTRVLGNQLIKHLVALGEVK